MVELHAPKILYLCDGLKECYTSPGCALAGYYDGECEHTTDPNHAKNGDVDYPQNHPERFRRVAYEGESRVIYVEKELHGPLFNFLEKGTLKQ